VRYIARGGHIEVLEGEVPRRAVIVEFPSRQAALEWYHGPAYTHARAIRQRASTGRLCIIDGVDEVPLE